MADALAANSGCPSPPAPCACYTLPHIPRMRAREATAEARAQKVPSGIASDRGKSASIQQCSQVKRQISPPIFSAATGLSHRGQAMYMCSHFQQIGRPYRPGRSWCPHAHCGICKISGLSMPLLPDGFELPEVRGQPGVGAVAAVGDPVRDECPVAMGVRHGQPARRIEGGRRWGRRPEPGDELAGFVRPDFGRPAPQATRPGVCSGTSGPSRSRGSSI